MSLRGLLIALVVFAFGCKQKEQHVHQPTTTRTKISVDDLLKPVNQTVIADVETITPQRLTESKPVTVSGTVGYNPNHIKSVAARTAGRIERLYVRYNFQPVLQGDKLLELYSPELVTAQSELLFVLHNDVTNTKLVEAARQKLRLLGMSEAQLRQLEANQTVTNTVAIYSSASGHIHEAIGSTGMNTMQVPAANQTQLMLKEGAYVQMGQTLFTIYDPTKLWVELNLPNGTTLEPGTTIEITTASTNNKMFTGLVEGVESSVREGNNFLVARVAIDNAQNDLVAGQLVTASLPANVTTGWWLPADAVIALGNSYAVLEQRNKNSFHVTSVNLADFNGSQYRVVSGIDSTTHIAAKAQFLIDNESFITADESR